ncbi:hypothetical protein NE236_02110 [Actinoallomurus purpureus]|uniref:hypothetical protein n=1 Tax=Actinoallomurus purpureus TaxID=478114 RepID=UPI00209322AE|nr:hypothetical protein [Actinoallomurus purpureus]MCO6003762.1 hypothetical protein [Actinoallomurus purpureus]
METLLAELCTELRLGDVRRESIRVWEMSGVERLRLDGDRTLIFKHARGPFTDEHLVLPHAAAHGLPVPGLLASATVYDPRLGSGGDSLGMVLEDLGPAVLVPTLGQAAAAIAVHADRKEMDPPAEGDTVTNHNYNYFIGESHFHRSNVGSNVFNNSPSGDERLEVRNLLAKVSQLLEAQSAHFYKTSDPQALSTAVQVIHEAVNQPDLPISKVRQALNVVVRVGEGLFVGVAGNELFEQIKQLAEWLSS